ncbi:hypothetical protein AZ78_3713 [Lysobacter capsici AZ78]|uniref:Uncharacterized protein n=1 Tax=Lysobacter capsici AZ78 TaxID=1444315 RepID=A0A108UBN3_9GAMM|nr:hypothetical protein AZ78_3713 [Lysobacter capsici AZ78]
MVAHCPGLKADGHGPAGAGLHVRAEGDGAFGQRAGSSAGASAQINGIDSGGSGSGANRYAIECRTGSAAAHRDRALRRGSRPHAHGDAAKSGGTRLHADTDASRAACGDIRTDSDRRFPGRSGSWSGARAQVNGIGRAGNGLVAHSRGIQPRAAGAIADGGGSARGRLGLKTRAHRAAAVVVVRRRGAVHLRLR